MNILIVDDDPRIIDGITNGVDFNAIGIDNVFRAYNSSIAKELLRSENISILVTDIEMPGESGIELLTWAKENHLDIISLFCTSYSDFNYAKKAIELHCYDYFLKPISYSALQKRLGDAVEHARLSRNIDDYKKQSDYWINSRNENKKSFWKNILNASASLSEIINAGKTMGISYSSETQYLLGSLQLSDDSLLIPQWKVYGFENITEEILRRYDLAPEAMIYMDGGIWMLIFQQTDMFEKENFTDFLKTNTNCAKTYLEADLKCYYQPAHSISSMREKLADINRIRKDNVLLESGICDVSLYSPRSLSYAPESASDWKLLLASGRIEELLDQIQVFLRKKSNNNEVNYSFLHAMRLDLTQMLYFVLSERGADVHFLFSGEEYDRYYHRSLLSVGKFIQYLQYTFTLSADKIPPPSDSNPLISEVTAFIDGHYQQNISRTSIASHFFLHPDYLARIFKGKTGKSIGEYLQDKRLNEGKRLLLQTSLSVSEIATKIGYDNSSYFSLLFRKKTGMRPNQYRKG